MADKWGNIGISDNQDGNFSIPQSTPTEVLRYAESELDKISNCFPDEKAAGLAQNAQALFEMSKDVWRIAKANVYLQLGEYNNAAVLLQQVIDSNHYNVSAGNDYSQNSGSIFIFKVADEIGISGHTCGFYTYSDVLLSRAECYVHSGYTTNAKKLVNQVSSAKNITISDNVFTAIETLRKQLFTPRYFAFQKRNGLGGYASYQHLWPIPSREIALSPSWRQNPGY